MFKQFEPHGRLHAEVKGNLLIIEGDGPWNKELLLESEQLIGDSITELYNKEWAVITIMHGDSMYIPEAENYLKSCIMKEKSLGRLATAVVIKDSSSFSLFEEYYQKLYESCGETVKCFHVEKEAFNWLCENFGCSIEHNI